MAIAVRVPFVDLPMQHADLEQEIAAATSKVLRTADFILGQEVELFEKEFAAFCGAKYAIGVDSGTSALELALRACGVGPGHEVITVANTFIATVLAISSMGAKPVLVDVDPHTHTLDVSRLEAAITSRTKAILPVHLYGHPADMDAINEIAQKHGLVVIEDACQAHGAGYKGRRVGALGHAAAFSFYPAKNLGACGDGGIVVTNDEQVADSVRMLRHYGQRKKYHHEVLGFNRRLDTIQAAVLRVKLKHLEGWNAARREHARRYAEALGGTPVATPEAAAYAEPVYHLYVIQCRDRDGLQTYLQDRGIATGIHYPIPVHMQGACKDLGYREGDFPVSECLAEQILSLPMYPELSSDLIKIVSDAVAGFFSEAAWQKFSDLKERVYRHAEASHNGEQARQVADASGSE